MAKRILMGLREYARHRGVALASVQDAIKAKRIPTVMEKGKKKIPLTDADKSWVALTNPAKAHHQKVEEDIVGPSYNQSRAIREAYQARSAKLTYEKEIGSVVDKEKVRLRAFDRGRKTREAILNLPVRISHELAAETDPHKIEVMLTEEIIKTLDRIVTDGRKEYE